MSRARKYEFRGGGPCDGDVEKFPGHPPQVIEVMGSPPLEGIMRAELAPDTVPHFPTHFYQLCDRGHYHYVGVR